MKKVLFAVAFEVQSVFDRYNLAEITTFDRFYLIKVASSNKVFASQFSACYAS